MGDLMKKMEDIKAQKVRNNYYFLIYFYAILVINIVADGYLVYKIGENLGDGVYKTNAEKWNWDIDWAILV